MIVHNDTELKQATPAGKFAVIAYACHGKSYRVIGIRASAKAAGNLYRRVSERMPHRAPQVYQA